MANDAETTVTLTASFGATVALPGADNTTESLIRRADEALRESENRYRLLFALNPQPMWVYDMETQRFIAVNEAALRLYRYGRDEFLGMDSIDSILTQPRRVESELPRLSKLVEVTTEKHRRKDGACLTVELTQHTMNLDNRLVAFVMISKVISCR